MNDETLDDELDLGTEKAPRPWKKILVIVLGALLLLGAAGGAAYFFLAPSEKSEKINEEGDEQADAQEGEAPQDEPEEEKGPAVYQSLSPVFVANLPPGGKAKMLQIGVEVMTRSEELADFLKHNDPMIRHNLLKLFSTRKASELADRAGKEKLQADVLAELQRIVKEQGGPGNVEAVYFTSFVMQ